MTTLYSIATIALGFAVFVAYRNARAERQARIDPSYGILTRYGFERALRGCAGPCAVMFLDMDFWKDVNDRGGYDGANAIMRSVFSQVRHTDLITGRWFSGDEVGLVLLPQPARRWAFWRRERRLRNPDIGALESRLRELFAQHDVSFTARTRYLTTAQLALIAIEQLSEEVKALKTAGRRGVAA